MCTSLKSSQYLQLLSAKITMSFQKLLVTKDVKRAFKVYRYAWPVLMLIRYQWFTAACQIRPAQPSLVPPALVPDGIASSNRS